MLWYNLNKLKYVDFQYARKDLKLSALAAIWANGSEPFENKLFFHQVMETRCNLVEISPVASEKKSLKVVTDE